MKIYLVYTPYEGADCSAFSTLEKAEKHLKEWGNEGYSSIFQVDLDCPEWHYPNSNECDHGCTTEN